MGEISPQHTLGEQEMWWQLWMDSAHLLLFLISDQVWIEGICTDWNSILVDDLFHLDLVVFMSLSFSLSLNSRQLTPALLGWLWIQSFFSPNLVVFRHQRGTVFLQKFLASIAGWNRLSACLVILCRLAWANL